MTLANFFTLLRILLIPVFVAVYYADIPWNHFLAAGIFVFACITDWLDGYLARRMNQCSPFGAFLDPVADKILVAITLVMLAANWTTIWFVLPAAIMVAREIIISALREWMAERQARGAVAVAYIGKVKTTVQMVAIVVLLASDPQGYAWMWQLGFLLIYIAAGLTVWSMYTYIRSAWPMLVSGLK